MKLTKLIIKEDIYSALDQAINQVDPDLGYKELAAGVAEILRENYGKHNYQTFLQELVSQLKKED